LARKVCGGGEKKGGKAPPQVKHCRHQTGGRGAPEVSIGHSSKSPLETRNQRYDYLGVKPRGPPIDVNVGQRGAAVRE